MRLILLAAILLPVSVLCQSKKNRPVFGKVDKEELLQNICEFDKDAEAVVLLDIGKLYFDYSGLVTTRELEHHVRIKILKDAALTRADIKLRYESYLNAEGINNITANTYNLDQSGNIVVSKLEKKLIYQKKINAKYSQQTFTFPDVKVGSIIEYKYTRRGYTGRNWNFQQDIPVKLSTYEINFPGAFELHTRMLCTLPCKSKDESSGIRTIKTYAMENIPALRDEEYISCENDYLQRIECWPVSYLYEGIRYPLLKTWKEVAKSLMEDDEFGIQLKKEIPRTADLDLELKKLTDPYQKMITVYDYVRKNMKWDGIDNFWASTGVKSAWKEKSGTSGEINLILINLLRDADIKVNPIMVSTRDNGTVNTVFPNINQFNKVLALVKINDKNYVLDGTDKYTPAGLIPENVMYSQGMVIDPQSDYYFRWMELWDPTRLQKNLVILQAKIDASGEMKGHATVTSMEYERTRRAPAIGNKEKYLKKFFYTRKTEFSIDSLNLMNGEIDSLPLVQDIDFHGPVNASGEYSYFSINLFSGMGANPFIADNRVSDIFFGTNQSHQIIASITIPEGYVFEELPKNMRMAVEDNSLVVTRMITAAGNILNTRTVVEIKRPLYTPEEYPDVQEFYKKMYSLLDEQIVIKKKL